MKPKHVLIISLIALGAILISACAPATQIVSAMETSAQSEEATANAAPGNGNGNENSMMADEECDGSGQAQGGNNTGHGHNGDVGGQMPTYAIGEISEAEAAGLAFMREEEKLARDVYLTLYDTWGLNIFNNIAASEQTHTDSVKALLEMYGIADPVTDDSIGVFVNADLQALYNDLVAKGNASLVDALEVGTAIEEIDILDLIDYIEGTDEANLKAVYENLKAGSENHLRAFVSQWEMQTGETYAPQYLSQEMYDSIISASSGNGDGRQGQGGGRGNSRSGGKGG